MKVGFLFCVAVCGMLTVSCHRDEGPENFEPQLIADAATNITRTEATLSGHVALSGNTMMPELRFRFGTTDNLDMESPQLTVTPDNVVVYALGGLKPKTTYRYCLQGSNGRVTLLSDIREFTTQPNAKPQVGSLKMLSYGPISAMVSYTILDDGGESITETGCYVTETNSGETQRIAVETSTIDKGMVVVRIGDLKQNTSYEMKAFAANSSGETQGEVLLHTTSNGVKLDAAGNLSQLIGEDWSGYETLSIIGDLNGDDLRLLRKMAGRDVDGTMTAGRLADINLADANIVAGGESYDGSHFSQRDTVGQGLFAGCTGLRNVVLPDDVTFIAKDVFLNCTSLTHIALPGSVTSIIPSSGCEALESITVSDANTSFKAIDGVLLNASATEIVWFPIGKKGAYTPPATLSAIGDYAFQGCLLTSIRLPDGLKTLGKAAFFNSRLESVVLPASLETIPRATFQGCTSLRVAYIGERTSLLGEYAFDGCPLSDLYIDATDPPLCYKSTFGSTMGEALSKCTVHVPAGKAKYYRAKEIWAKAARIVEQQD